MTSPGRTMGIEEEYLLLGPDGVPTAVAGAALKAVPPPDDDSAPGGDVGGELKQQQLETGTRPCTDLGELAREVREARVRAQQAAGTTGARIVAMGTSPVEVSALSSPNPRYLELNRRFGLTAREQLTCGCHVHVGVSGEDEGVAVLDRLGRWLPLLLALSANSPFWQGTDSGYASYRSQVWSRWPSAGPTAPFGSAAAYRTVVEELVATGTIMDAGMVYFDARLSARYPTVEVRVADVCLDPQDAVLVAALSRGLVETAADEARRGEPAPDVRVELLRAATWQAGRWGLGSTLLDPWTFEPVSAGAAVGRLIEHVGPSLDGSGDLGLVCRRVEELLDGGTGADAQRRWYADGGAVEVADRAAEATLT